MKPLLRKPMLAFAALALVLAACTLPVAPTPTPFVFPTPNLTLTALFQIPPIETPVPVSTAVPVTATSTYCTGTNLANFVSETVPDGTSITPGALFTKTWTLSNVGTCTWTTAYSLVFDSGVQMGGPASVPLAAAVPPGSSVTLSVNLYAPSVVGSYQGYWRLSTDQGVRFGVGAGGASAFWLKIYAGTPPPPIPACYVPKPPKRPSANGFTEAYYTGGSTAAFPLPDMTTGDIASDPFWNSPLPYTADHLAFKSSNYSVPTNYTVSYELKWDSTNLYVAAEVVDPNYVQEATGGNMYKGDSLEILLDRDPAEDYCARFLGEDDFQLGLSAGSTPAPGVGEAYLWYPKSEAGSKPVVNLTGVVVSVAPVGWNLKAVIPWSVFGVSPTGSEYYGFALGVSDNQVSGTAQQQGLWSNDQYRLLTNPMTWGTLQIEIKTHP
jgi:hypothetical protein